MSKSLNMKVGTKNVTMVFAGAALVTLVAGGSLIFVMNGRISAERARETALEAQVGSSEQVTKRLQATQDAYDQTRSKIAFLETSDTQKSYVPTLLQQLQSLAASTRLFVATVQPSQITTPSAPAAGSDQKKAAAPPYETMGVNLNVTGTYADTQQFLYGLTHFPKIISVTSIQMSPGASGPTASATATPVTTSLRLTAYVFPDDTTSATPATVGAATGGTAQPPATVVPPPTAPTMAGAAGRATHGAVMATQAANAHGSSPASTL